MNINKNVGSNIKKYRTANRMTLRELSGKLHKSVSTISKYETGGIPLDIPTLMELARIFHTSPYLLLGSVDPDLEEAGASPSSPVETLYMYHFGRQNRSLIQNVLEQCPSAGRPNVRTVQLFNDVKDPDNPGTCAGIYSGNLITEGYIGTYILQNRALPYEYVTIFSIKNLLHPDQSLGMVTCLSNYTMLPISFKTLISQKKIANTDAVKEILSLSKQDFSFMRKTGCFSLRNFK